MMATWKPPLNVILTIGVLATGVHVRSEALQATQDRGADAGKLPVTAPLATPSPLDFPDDPLPKYARARLGTNRFHSRDNLDVASYTPDGKFAFTLGNGRIRVWDSATGRIVRAIGDSESDFRAMAISPAGNTLATTAGFPSRLRLWDLPSGREQRRWHVAKAETYYGQLCFSPDGKTLVVGVSTNDQTAGARNQFVDLLDLAAKTERRRRIVGDWFGLRDLKFSPDGKMLAAASIQWIDVKGRTTRTMEGSTHIWNVATGEERLRSKVDGYSVHSVAFSSDSNTLATAIEDGSVRRYDVGSGKEVMPRLSERFPMPRPGEPEALRAWSRGMHSVAFSPDGTILAAGAAGTDEDGDPSLARIYLWDAVRSRKLAEIPVHYQVVSSLSFSPDGKTLASAGHEEAVLFWNVATGREAFPQGGHCSQITAIAISRADGTVFTSGLDATIRQWDPSSGRELAVIASLANTSAQSLAVAPDGKSVVFGGMHGRRALWSIPRAREIDRFPHANPEASVHHVGFSPDGSLVASDLHLWDVATGRIRVQFPYDKSADGGSACFFPLFFSHDGKEVIATENRGVRILDVASGKERRWAVRASLESDRLALSVDGRFLAAGGAGPRVGWGINPRIRVWELASGREVARLRGHEEKINGLSFSPDGRLLASCSGDYRSDKDMTVRVWDLATGQERRRFDGHRGPVRSVAFTPDGRWVVSGSEDCTGLVWDVSDLGVSPKPDPG